jgi:hypothetical protein
LYFTAAPQESVFVLYCSASGVSICTKRAHAPPILQRLRCQYLYFCTSEASKLSTCHHQALCVSTLLPSRTNCMIHVSIRQHTSAYVSKRQHTVCLHTVSACVSIRHTSACVSIRQHNTSAYVSIRQHTSACVSIRQHTSAYVSIRQHTSAYVSIRQHTSAYVSIRQHTVCLRTVSVAPALYDTQAIHAAISSTAA